MKRDPKPLEEMTNEEKRLLAQHLREEMKHLPYDPDDNSLELLEKMLAKPLK